MRRGRVGVASISSPVPAVGRAEISPLPSETAHEEHELHRETEGKTPDEHTVAEKTQRK